MFSWLSNLIDSLLAARDDLHLERKIRRSVGVAEARGLEEGTLPQTAENQVCPGAAETETELDFESLKSDVDSHYLGPLGDRATQISSLIPKIKGDDLERLPEAADADLENAYNEAGGDLHQRAADVPRAHAMLRREIVLHGEINPNDAAKAIWALVAIFLLLNGEAVMNAFFLAGQKSRSCGSAASPFSWLCT